MVRIKRVDIPDSFQTLFIVEIEPNHHQEVKVPIWIADMVEQNMKAKDFDTEKNKSGESDVLI